MFAGDDPQGYPWLQPAALQQAQRLLASYQYWTQTSLLEVAPNPLALGQQLFAAPFVLLSHGDEADPILNYGNQTALSLWDYAWTEFTQMPSRLTAEPQVWAERAELLQEAATRGVVSGCRGVRVTRTGRRFWIENAMIWDVLDEQGQRCGQAAWFDHWRFLDAPSGKI